MAYIDTLPIVNSSILAVVAIAIGFNQYRNSQNSTAKDTVQILKDNIAAKDLEIAQMRASHDTAIAEMKANITSLTSQIESLKQANIVLSNTVTGKDILGTIVEVLKPIPTLFMAGGFIERVELNQQKTLKDLAEIREAMKLSPSLSTPEDHQFKDRNHAA